MIAVAVNHCICWTIVTIMLSMWGNTKPSSQVLELFDQARTAYLKHDYDGTIRGCDKALRLDSKHFASYIVRGHAHFMKHDWERARVDYGAAIRLTSEELHSYNDWGLVGTLVNLPRVLYLGQLLVDAHIGSSAIFAQTNDFERAIASLTKAISLKPKDPMLYRDRAMAHASRKEFSLAMADSDRLVSLAPDQADSYVFRSTVHLAEAGYDHALADLNQAIRHNSHFAPAFYYRGIVYQSRKDYARALADFERSANIDPQHYQACFTLAQYFFGSSQPELHDPQKELDYTCKGPGVVEKARREEYEMNTPQFAIPIYIPPSDRGRIVTIRVFVSNDKGKTWKHEKDYQPSDECIIFTAPHNGRYWFAVQTVLKDGNRNPADLSSLVPAMKVYASFEGKTPKSQNTHEAPKREEKRSRVTIE